MRTLTLTVTLVALVSQGGVAFAQQSTQGAVAEATPIEKVLEANPEVTHKLRCERSLLAQSRYA
jgi:hypothetical protein